MTNRGSPDRVRAAADALSEAGGPAGGYRRQRHGIGSVLPPMMLALVASSMISSRVIARTGNYKWYPLLSMALGIIAAVLLSSMDAQTTRQLGWVLQQLHDPGVDLLLCRGLRKGHRERAE